jgi:tRNA1Val (adenine37-N6)-methyltransferase
MRCAHGDAATAMKVGTDGVLLGAWAPVAGVRRILDIGCGSGLIAHSS